MLTLNALREGLRMHLHMIDAVHTNLNGSWESTVKVADAFQHISATEIEVTFTKSAYLTYLPLY